MFKKLVNFVLFSFLKYVFYFVFICASTSWGISPAGCGGVVVRESTAQQMLCWKDKKVVEEL